MSNIYYYWFPGDYLRDTLTLTETEDLMYRRLLDHYYMQGPLPADMLRIHLIARVKDAAGSKAVEHVVQTYFHKEGDFYRNKKADKEIQYRESTTEAKSRAGKASAERRQEKYGTTAPLFANTPRTEERTDQRTEPRTEVRTADEPPYPYPNPHPNQDQHPHPESGRDALPFASIIGYLNEKTGSHFRHFTPLYRKCIKARFKDGFVFPDFIMVIDKKTEEWKGDPKMSQYLRPETLFSGKMETYLNGARSMKGKVSQAGGRTMATMERWLAKGGKKELASPI